MKSVQFQNNLILTLVIALVVGSLLANTALVPVAIAGGFITAMLFAFFNKKKTKSIEFKSMPTWVVMVIDAVFAAIGSQTGWLALLV